MRGLALLTLLLVPALAGCLDASLLRGIPTCEGLATLSPSGNAPLTPTLRLAPEQLARRLAEAAGDALTDRTDAEPVGEPAAMWGTREGHIEYFETDEGGFGRMRYWRDGFWTPLDASRAQADFAALMDRLDIPPEAHGGLEVETRDDDGQRRVEGRTQPSFDGRIVLGAGPGDDAGVRFFVVDNRRDDEPDRSQIELRPMYDLSGAQVRLSHEQAQRIGARAVECELRAQGTWDTHRGTLTDAVGEPRLAVANDSLGHLVGVGYGTGCAESRLVYVVIDAVTGAVLRYGEPGAGCVE